MLLDHFSPGCSDEEWLSRAAEKLDLDDSADWVVLTKDKWIRRRPNQRAAIEKAGVAAFVLTGKGLTGQEMGDAFAKSYPRIRKLLRDYEPPFVAAVSKSGSVRLLTEAKRRASIRRDKQQHQAKRKPRPQEGGER